MLILQMTNWWYFPYILIFWDHLAHSGYFENWILLKSVPGELMELHKLNCCIWRDLIKPSLPFSFFWFSACSVFPKATFQGPVVQSIISLTSSLLLKMLTVLVNTISNSQVFLLEKMWVAFANAKPTHICSAKILAYTCMPYLMIKVLKIR